MLEKKIILVTGGLGFIGKHCVRRALDQGFFVINIDMVSYAADLKEKKLFEEHPNYRFIQHEIQSLEYLPECDVIFNFAAESHVDRAISSNKKFCLSNFMGVQNLLELVSLKQALERPLFLQISTDEVYGDIEQGAAYRKLSAAAFQSLLGDEGRGRSLHSELRADARNTVAHHSALKYLWVPSISGKAHTEERLAHASRTARPDAWQRFLSSLLAARRRCD